MGKISENKHDTEDKCITQFDKKVYNERFKYYTKIKGESLCAVEEAS